MGDGTSSSASAQGSVGTVRLGLVAGGGRLPFLVAEGARRSGVDVICVGIRHEVSPELEGLCRSFRRIGLGKLGATFRFFHRHRVQEVSWAGWIRKERIFSPWRLLSLLPDRRMLRFYFRNVRSRQDAALFAALADEFESEGFHLVPATKYCPELLAPEGIYTRRKPTRAELEDIRFGWLVAKRLADLDVGQSVAVYEKATLAVEGIEGTDRNIRRAGELCRRGGFTVVKLAKDRHDMRFDIPTVGPETIDAIREAGGAVLALEAGRTLIVDRDALLETADRHGIVVGAWSGPPGD
jgi:DUF1009 family protein